MKQTKQNKTNTKQNQNKKKNKTKQNIHTFFLSFFLSFFLFIHRQVLEIIAGVKQMSPYDLAEKVYSNTTKVFFAKQ